MKDIGNPVINKIQNNRGESLTETLVALLISALAILMLAGAVTAASRIITRTRTDLEKYYGANECLVKMTENSTYDVTAGTCTVSISDGTDTDHLSADYAMNGVYSDKVVAFRLRK